MLIKAKCKKCGHTGMLSIDNHTRKEVEDILKAKKTFTCAFSEHEEVGSPMNYLEIDWDNLIDGKPETEEEFLENLKKIYHEVYTREELEEKYVIDKFGYGGQCVAHLKDDEDYMTAFSFIHSPEGKRYYIDLPKLFEDPAEIEEESR